MADDCSCPGRPDPAGEFVLWDCQRCGRRWMRRQRVVSWWEEAGFPSMRITGFIRGTTVNGEVVAEVRNA